MQLLAFLLLKVFIKDLPPLIKNIASPRGKKKHMP